MIKDAFDQLCSSMLVVKRPALSVADSILGSYSFTKVKRILSCHLDISSNRICRLASATGSFLFGHDASSSWNNSKQTLKFNTLLSTFRELIKCMINLNCACFSSDKCTDAFNLTNTYNLCIHSDDFYGYFLLFLLIVACFVFHTCKRGILLLSAFSRV